MKSGEYDDFITRVKAACELLQSKGIDCRVGGPIAARFHLLHHHKRTRIAARDALIVIPGPMIEWAREVLGSTATAGLRLQRGERELKGPVVSKDDLPMLTLEELVPLLLESFKLAERLLIKELDEEKLIPTSVFASITGLQRERLEQARQTEDLMEYDDRGEFDW